MVGYLSKQEAQIVEEDEKLLEITCVRIQLLALEILLFFLEIVNLLLSVRV